METKLTRLGLMTLSAAAMAIALTGGSAKAQTNYGPGASDTEIKIGNTAAYSGATSNYSVIPKTQAAYFKMINSEGGINGRKINFISYDDGYSPPKTVEQTRKLVEGDEVLFTFSQAGTGNNMAIRAYMNQKHVPQIFIQSGSSKWGDPEHFPWTMSWQPNNQSEGRIYARYILENLPNAKIAVMYQNDDYGKDYLKGLKEGLGDKAASMIVAEDSYDSSEPTVDSHIVKLAATKADVFVDISIQRYAAQAIRKANEIGWKPLHILNSISTSVSSVMKTAGFDASQGILSAAFYMDPTDPQWKDNPNMKEWVAFMDKWNPGADKADYNNVYAYAQARTLVQVLKQCGNDLTRENVLKQAANLKDFDPGVLLPGITVSTSPTDYYPIEQWQMMRFQGETWKLFGTVISGKAH